MDHGSRDSATAAGIVAYAAVLVVVIPVLPTRLPMIWESLEVCTASWDVSSPGSRPSYSDKRPGPDTISRETLWKTWAWVSVALPVFSVKQLWRSRSVETAPSRDCRDCCTSTCQQFKLIITGNAINKYFYLDIS